MQRYHVRITPRPDEPQLITAAQARAELAWIREHCAEGGPITAVEAFEEGTGLYLVAQVADRDALGTLLDGYPLAHTRRMWINQLSPSLGDASAALLAAVARRIEQRTPATVEPD